MGFFNTLSNILVNPIISIPGVNNLLGQQTGVDVAESTGIDPVGIRPRPSGNLTLEQGTNQAYELSSGQTTDNAFQIFAPAGSPTTYDIFNVYSYYKTVEGTGSADTIYGNTDLKNGNGRIIFNAVSETINARGGNDTVYGREGNDKINGQGGNDNLFGGPGFDTITGGIGSDFMSTGTISSSAEGQDLGRKEVLTGGAGPDTFFLGERPGDAPLESDNVNVANGVDWGKLALGVAGDVTDLAFTAFLPGKKIAKEITPMIFDVTKAFAGASSQPEPLTGGSFAQITDFDPREDVVLIPVRKGRELFFSKDTNGSSDISIKYQDGNGLKVLATIELTSEFSDTAAVERVVDSLQRNSLTLNSDEVSQGARVIQNNGNIDTAKSNKQVLAQGTGQTQLAASDKENLGNTRFMVIGAFSGVEDTGSISAEYMYGTNYGDVLVGYQLDDVGGTGFAPDTAGNDEMRGYGGNDSFYGGAGTNKFFGGLGSDTALYVHSTAGINANLNLVQNQAYAQVSNGFGGKDQLYSIENIVGSDNKDTIIGNNDPNVLAGAKGDDSLTGNGGADTFVFSTGDTNLIKIKQAQLDSQYKKDKLGSAPTLPVLDFGTKTITDFNPAEDKIQIDVKAYYDHYKSIDFKSSHNASDDTLTIELAGHNVATLENINSSQKAVNALQQIEFIGEVDTTGTENAIDILIGDNGNNSLFGIGGNDYIYGGDGDDTLLGGRDNDVMLGGNGNDYLRGKENNDILIGGTGADTFAFLNYAASSGASHTILDFTPSEGDKIQIDIQQYYNKYNSVDFNYTHDETKNTLALSVSGRNFATLENISKNQIADALQQIEFTGQVNTSGTGGVDILIGNSDRNLLEAVNGDDYIYGSDASDTVYGGAGKDVLLGGDGPDFMRGHQGDDILIGGDGADMFAFLNASVGTGVDTIMDFNASEEDRILIATNHYGISDLSEVTFENNQLLVKGNVIANLENHSGFAVNNTNLLLESIDW
ncbi:MAG: hypothetical protein AAGJ08_12500 [Cyanobacteria bacterium P01_H01_bin.35]